MERDPLLQEAEKEHEDMRQIREESKAGTDEAEKVTLWQVLVRSKSECLVSRILFRHFTPASYCRRTASTGCR